MHPGVAHVGKLYERCVATGWWNDGRSPRDRAGGGGFSINCEGGS